MSMSPDYKIILSSQHAINARNKDERLSSLWRAHYYTIKRLT